MVQHKVGATTHSISCHTMQPKEGGTMCCVLAQKYVLHNPLEDENASSKKQVHNTNGDHQTENNNNGTSTSWGKKQKQEQVDRSIVVLSSER